MVDDSFDVFLLGAGSPKSGLHPSALTKLGSGSSALEWQLHSFDEFPVHDFHFVGGYYVEAVIAAYPHLNYTVIPDWQHHSILHSLLKAPLRYRNSIVHYADTIFRKEVIAQLLTLEGDVAFAFDTTWKDRYALRTADDIKEAETVTVDHESILVSAVSDQGNNVTQAEFTGAIRLSPKVMRFISTVEEGDIGRSLVDLLEFLSRRGFSVRGCDIRGDWAEFNSPNDIAHFVLGTKAETLFRLAPRVSSCTIGDQVTFTTGDWQADRPDCLTRIRAKLSDCNLILRSSAKGEDTWDRSNAGGFESILNVNANAPDEISKAVETVISSFDTVHRPEQDQILVQKMVDDVKSAGVVFTRGLENGAPYYRFNFDDQTSSTDSVTSGAFGDLRTVITHRASGALLKETAPEPISVLDAVDDLERLLGFDKLDIEFAIDRNDKIHIFQVRPITVDHSDFQVTDDDHVAAIEDAISQFHRLQQPNPFTVGKCTFFGNMLDWNPAEIVGTRPKPLSLSLYRRIITDEVWALQRSEFGYRDVLPHPLIVLFCGPPYVDIRASLNSFVPAALSDDIAERLVNAYLQILQGNPSCHDKLEFEVAFTVWTPSFLKEAHERLLPYGVTREDIDALESALKGVTKRVKDDVKSVEALVQRRAQLEGSHLAHLDKAVALLDDCRRFGTLAFSHAARAGFVATSFLKSFVAEGVICEAERENFMRSIDTVAGDFERDKDAVARNSLDRNDLIERYGHLRPGTYEPSVEAYWESPERYLFGGSASYESFEFSFSRDSISSIGHHVRRFHASFSYQAGSWGRKRRVVAKVEWHIGELYPRVGFIVTNLSLPAERVVAFYNQRGTAEQHIKEGKNAIRWTRLSCQKFRNNEVRLQLHALAYNLGNFLRTLALPKAVEQWSLTTLREKLQDRREGRAPRTLYHVPAGRSRDTPRSVRRHPAPHRPAQTEASPNMTVRLSNIQPRHGIAMPGARRERCHRTLRRPISAPTQCIGGMHVPRASACCLPGGNGAQSTPLKEPKWGIPD
jgi:choline kinase